MVRNRINEFPRPAMNQEIDAAIRLAMGNPDAGYVDMTTLEGRDAFKDSDPHLTNMARIAANAIDEIGNHTVTKTIKGERDGTGGEVRGTVEL